MKSMGFKIYITVGIMGVLFLAMVFLNISGIGTIGEFNSELGQIYVGLEANAGYASTAFQQVQLDANLVDYKPENLDVTQSSLEAAISSTRSYMQSVKDGCNELGDQELSRAFASYSSSMDAFLDYATQIYDSSVAGDTAKTKELVDGLSEVTLPVQSSLGTFAQTLATKAQAAVDRSESRIQGTIVFDWIVAGVYIIVLTVAILVVAATLVKPASESGRALRAITAKLRAGEGDLTERVPVKSKDEVGQMAAGINNFMDQLQKIMQELKTESGNMA